MDASTNDPHDLQRFLDAQRAVFGQVTHELARGAKQSHWMWFVFPQLKGLGRSVTAQHYGIASRAEARAYWQHQVLGERLMQCTRLVMAVQGRSAHQIFGSPDDLKFRSSMTLFEKVAPEAPIFADALEKYFAGHRDEATLAGLGTGRDSLPE